MPNIRLIRIAAPLALLSIAEMNAVAAPMTETEKACIQHAMDAWSAPVMREGEDINMINSRYQSNTREYCRRLNACSDWGSPGNARLAYENCLKEEQSR
jgi:hypothetical protein